jgi:1-deoxy-D-xylulose-5-phosphate synthase
VTHATLPVDKDYSALNKYQVTRRGKEVAIIAAGTFYGLGEATADILKSRGIEATLINPRFLSGVDVELLESLKSDHKLVVTLEDGVLDGGYGEKVARFFGDSSVRVKCYGLPKQFRDRYNAAELLKECHLEASLLADDIAGIVSE